jgi:hypothetical protein
VSGARGGTGAKAAAARAVALAGLVLGAVSALSGCATEKGLRVDFSDKPRDYVGKDYERVYQRWTRHQQAFQDVDVALEVWATFKSWDFREAYIERYAEIYSLSDADEQALREAQRKLLSEVYEFHVTAQASNYKWNDLEKTSSSAWRVALVDALGHELAPDSVKIEKLPDAVETIFYPQRTPFTKSYAIRFVVPGDASPFTGTRSGAITLRIASPVGRIELEWRSG